MPPDTTNYMILGYAVVAIVLISIVGYLVVKARNLRAELEMLKSLKDEEESAPNKGVKVDNSPRPTTLR
jgi:hypothetical protein